MLKYMRLGGVKDITMMSVSNSSDEPTFPQGQNMRVDGVGDIKVLSASSCGDESITLRGHV